MERKRLEGGVQEKLSAEDLQKRDSLLGHGASNGAGPQPGRNSPTQSTGLGGRARRPRTKSQVDHVLGTDTIEECVRPLPALRVSSATAYSAQIDLLTT